MWSFFARHTAVENETKHIACHVVDNAKEGKNIELWGNPHIKRDIIYVKDYRWYQDI